MLPDPGQILASAPVDGAVEGTIGGLILYISVALGFSFLCSILEAALLSTSLSHIGVMVKQGSRAGLLMHKHKENVENPISAILTLNTVAHTVGAAGAGAQAAGVFGNEWFGVISAVLTLLILVFSEIIPKTLGAVYWKQLFTFSAYAIEALVILFWPAVWVFNKMGRLLAPSEESPSVTVGELEIMASIGASEGTLKERDFRILSNLLRLTQIRVKDIMTPRTVLMAFQQDTTVSEVIEQHPLLRYSRIPVYETDIDHIVGIVLRHDILSNAANGGRDKTLQALLRPIHSVPESLSVADALDLFTSRQEHVFRVFDEYGGTEGIITLEDAMESLIGSEIVDESDLVTDLRELAQQRYRGRFPAARDDEPKSSTANA
ncbi:MAG: HlyC/CorC family transporter [Chloroflexi bacterium]|nr:HlyC/CorC family transporter [Chloroflexota bacterium]